MASIDITTQSGAVGNGDLQLQNGAPMDGTLRFVTDAVNTASPLKLSTSLVQTTSTLKITTNDNPYIDAEDGAGNNRFTVGRDTGSQQVNVDFASNPGGSTTIVGAIRTYVDGVNLSEVMAFREDGNVGIGTTSPGAKLDIHSASNVITQFNRIGAGKSWIQFQQAGTARWNTGYDNTNGNYTIYDAVNAADRMVVTNAGNVGIGTSTPLALLHISQSGANTICRIGNNSAYDQFIYFNGGNDFSLGMDASNSNAFVLSNASTLGTNDRLVVTTTGNVGIGTSTPDNTLDLGSPSQGRGLTFDNYSNLFSSYSAGDLVLSNNFYGSTSSDTYLTSVTASFGAAGIRVSATSGTALGGQIQFFANTATSKTAGTAFTPTEICRVTPNGLTFNGDTAAANALDDYEEGTWTPVFSGTTFSGTIAATYTKIGRLVTVQMNFINQTLASSAGAASISGLPFTCNSATFGIVSFTFCDAVSASVASGYVGVSGTAIQIRTNTGINDTSFVDGTSNRSMMLTATYFV